MSETDLDLTLNTNNDSPDLAARVAGNTFYLIGKSTDSSGVKDEFDQSLTSAMFCLAFSSRRVFRFLLANS